MAAGDACAEIPSLSSGNRAIVTLSRRDLRLLIEALNSTQLLAGMSLMPFPLCSTPAGYLEDSFIKSGVFSVSELVRVSRSKCVTVTFGTPMGGG